MKPPLPPAKPAARKPKPKPAPAPIIPPLVTLRPHAFAGRIKLVAIDLDGTLLTSQKTVTPNTLAALRAALKKGVKIILATARPPRSVRHYYHALKLDTPTINYNGALIWDEPNQRVIEHTPLAADVARKIIAMARKRFPEILVSVEILDKWYTDHFDENPAFMTETGKHFTPDFVGPIEAFLTVPITKLMLLGKPDWIEALERALPRRFGHAITSTRSDNFLLQIMSPGVSKAVALERVARLLKIDSRHVMAIGDAPNDIHMMQWAGLAVAPQNAWAITKTAAHYLVPSNDHDGIATALKRFVL